ncbi:MAG: aspartate aminotransferase family protein [Gammaproteobacteria bacterium]|nr:aspartate aminotransferase family protein [Gammaproteobacteria bacterium]
MLSQLLNICTNLINNTDHAFNQLAKGALKHIEPTTLIATSAEAILLTQKNYSLTTYLTAAIASYLQIKNGMAIHQEWNSKKIMGQLLDAATLTAVRLPYVGPKVESTIIKGVKDLLGPYKDHTEQIRNEIGIVPIEVLPETGMAPDEIRKLFINLHQYYKQGTHSGSVYNQFEAELFELLKDVFGATALTNPMHPIWPLINEMEAMVFSICKNLFHAPEDTHGILTHGGTGSIIEACNAYVQYARQVLGIENPEIIVPDTIHVAFDDKTSKLLHAKLVPVPVDPLTGKADVAKMEAAITRNTILLVGSAPCFPYGVIDPIQDLANLAKKHHIFLHVDACLGGFLFPFANPATHKLPVCDFAADGVNSISADIHKFGLGPKGLSIALFRNRNLFSPTPTYANLSFKGGLYVTPGFLDGSRSGASVALALTVLLYYGKDKYKEITEKILNVTEKLTERLKQVEGITVPFTPDLSLIYLRTDPNINHHLVAEKFEEPDKEKGKFGWSVNDMAHGFHFCLTSEHTQDPEFVNNFVRDLESAIQYVKSHPNEKPKGVAKAYKYIDTGFLPPVIQNLVGDIYERISQTLPHHTIPFFWKAFAKNENVADKTVNGNEKTALTM